MWSSGEVVSVNISAEKGTPKRPVEGALVDEQGIVGDAHAGPWHRQVSILGQESIDRFMAAHGVELSPGAFAENLAVRGLELKRASLLDRFRIGEVELEVTQIGKECHGEACSIYERVGTCLMPTEGLFCRVVHGGRVGPGDAVEYVAKVLRCRVITLSDRAASGLAEDRSGPRAKELLAEYLRGTRWRAEITTTLLPDDAARLRAELEASRDSGVDVAVTTGGTGVGPRDVTPEVVSGFCDKLIPGIMEMIRLRYGAEKPNALLSRSVAGVAGTMLVYALPGSVRAVEEYMGEIVRTLEHLLLMVRGIDAH